jgi:DNA topoisomerase III
MIEHLNYLEVYPFEKWSDKTIPLYHSNETFVPTNILFTSGQTEPPLPLAENELIELMDKNGIGSYFYFRDYKTPLN